MLWFKVKSSHDPNGPKLGVDLAHDFARHEAMEEKLADDFEQNELVVQLCTRLGMMMEDLSPFALDASPEGQRARVIEIALRIQTMAAIANAAKALIDL